VFNYRMITGPCPLSKNAVAVARDGVYFINPAGVWRTTGGQPELVSGPVQALFRGALPPTFSTGVSLSQTSTAAAFTAGWQPDRLYFGIPLSNGATTATHTLVYDVRGGWWSIYDLAAGVLLGTPDTGAHPTQDHGLLFSYASGNKDIGKLDSTTTNNGSSLAAYWVSGNSDFGSPDYKSVRQIEVTGKASAGLTLAVGTDYGALGSTASLSPGSSVATVFDRRGWRGRQFRVKVAQASGTMEIERLVLRVRDRKSPGVSR
jgi:hypothetical protein